jgi:hypothetical protein
LVAPVLQANGTEIRAAARQRPHLPRKALLLLEN